MVLDYDRLPQREVIKDARRIRRKYGLGKVTLKVTNKWFRCWHYHVEFERRVDTPEEVRAIILDSQCCEKYKEYAEIFNFTVQRTAPSKTKPKPIILKTF